MLVDITSICYNEEVMIQAWIDSWLSVPFVNRIYLVDAGSTDKTLEIARGYDRVRAMFVPWKNDFSRQRNIVLRMSKPDIEYVFQPDIDELPCGNLNIDFDDDDKVNEIIIPYVKFYNLSKLWFFKNGSTPSINGKMVQYAVNKSTTTIFKKTLLGGYSKPLHEMPFYKTARLKKIGSHLGQSAVSLDDLSKDFFIGHYDQAKHFLQAKKSNTTVEYEMGLKRARYRLISEASYDKVIYTKWWAEKVLNDNNVSEIEKLGAAQLNSFLKEHDILDDFDARNLNNVVVRSLFDV